MTGPTDGRGVGIPVAGLPLCTPLAMTVPTTTGRARGGDRACCAGLPAGGTVTDPSVPPAPQAAPGVRGRAPYRRRSAGRAGRPVVRTLPVGVRALGTAALVVAFVAAGAGAGFALGSLAALALLLYPPR